MFPIQGFRSFSFQIPYIGDPFGKAFGHGGPVGIAPDSSSKSLGIIAPHISAKLVWYSHAVAHGRAHS